MIQPAFSRGPTEIVEAWAQYLEPSDLSALRLVCTQADKQTFDVWAKCHFSMRRTSLMGTSLRNLEAVAGHKSLRKYVKTIFLVDDLEEVSENARPVSWNVWPRDKAGKVVPTLIGLKILKAMLLAQQLRPETIKIRDYRKSNAVPSPEAAAVLAEDIREGGSLAILSVKCSGAIFIRDRGRHEITTVITLSPQHQGRGIGFSMLRSVHIAGPYITSDWSNQIFHHTPSLEELRLTSLDPRQIQQHCNTILTIGSPVRQLKHFEINATPLCASAVMAIIATSQPSLTSIVFVGTRLDRRSTWRELLTAISNNYLALTSFHLSGFAQGPSMSSKAVKFQGLCCACVAERHGACFSILEEDLDDKRLAISVNWKGSNASEVLKMVAASVITP